MSIRKKAIEVIKSENNERELKDMYFKAEPNSTTKIVPLVSFEEIDEFGLYPFGQGSSFWTIVDTDESDDLGKALGFSSKSKYIMPIVYWNEADKAWSEPMFYNFPTSVYQAFSLIASSSIGDKIKEEMLENEDVEGFESQYSFKGSILTLVRDDKTANSITAYNVQWSGDMWGKTKNTKGLDLPASDSLNLELGACGDVYNEDPIIMRQNILNKLIDHSDFIINPDDKFDKGKHLGATIGERLAKLGLLESDNWDNLETSE